MTKVTAHLDKPETTIDNDTGEVQVTRTGVMKGFGQGFREYLKKGNKLAQPDITVNTGSLPGGHAHEGKWAIQILLEPLETEEDAVTLADRLTSVIKSYMLGPQIGKRH